MASNTYNIDPTLASGCFFDLSCGWGLLFNTYYNALDIHRPPGLDVGTKVWYKQRIKYPNSNYIQATIISIYTDHI